MIYTIKNEALTVAVKSFGAELTSIKTNHDNLEYLWQGDEAVWSGQAINLFPIIGGLPGNCYTLGGREYHMLPHGFAMLSEFELIDKRETSLALGLSSDEKTMAIYPYHFKLVIDFRLVANRLIVTYQVINRNPVDLLFSVGGHPGFNCPLFKGESINDYKLVWEKDERIEQRIKFRDLLSGERLTFMSDEREKPLSHQLFVNGAIILDSVQSSWLEIQSRNHDRAVRVEFPDFPYLGIWSRNHASFICIEPWYGIDSTAGDTCDFDSKEGLQHLSAGGEFSCSFSILLN